MTLLLFLCCLVFSCLTFSWLKLWGKMTDAATPAAKNRPEASFVPSQEPLPAPSSPEEEEEPPPQKNGQGGSLPKTPSQAEPAPQEGPSDADWQRAPRPPRHRHPSRSPFPSRDASPANMGTRTHGREAPDANGLSSPPPPPPARPQARARALSKEDQKQARLKRRLMTNFILGSFDDISSDEDAGAGAGRESSRRGSRAGLGALTLEAARAAGDSDTLVTPKS